MSDGNSSAHSSSICLRVVSPPDTQIKSQPTFCAICRSAYILSPTTTLVAVVSGFALQQTRVRLTKDRARFGRLLGETHAAVEQSGRRATGWRFGRCNVPANGCILSVPHTANSKLCVTAAINAHVAEQKPEALSLPSASQTVRRLSRIHADFLLCLLRSFF